MNAARRLGECFSAIRTSLPASIAEAGLSVDTGYTRGGEGNVVSCRSSPHCFRWTRGVQSLPVKERSPVRTRVGSLMGEVGKLLVSGPEGIPSEADAPKVIMPLSPTRESARD